MRATSLNPGNPIFFNNMAAVCHERGDLRAAEENSRNALALAPGYADAQGNLGKSLFSQGRSNEAIDTFRKGLELNPEDDNLWFNAGLVQGKLGKLNEAKNCFMFALKSNPNHVEARQNALIIMGNRPVEAYDRDLENFYKDSFSFPYVDYQGISRAAASLLMLKYRPEEIEINEGLLKKISSDAFFLEFLEKTKNNDPELEKLMTQVRRALLFQAVTKKNAVVIQKLMSGFAKHCFYNEYVFWAEADEMSRVNELKRSIESHFEKVDDSLGDMEHEMLAFSMYAPLCDLSCAPMLRERSLDDWSAAVRSVVQNTLFEPMEEEEIKKAIPTVGKIENTVSLAVQSQYEENPYPRWNHLPAQRWRNFAASVKEVLPHFEVPEFLKGPVQMLSAGCGTGQEPIRFLGRHSNVEILAVDLSRSSLAYAQRMAKKLGIGNVRFVQGDILNLDELDQKFHVISSGGVLHHMERPLEGLNVLRELLVPGGLMRIALYSKLARRFIDEARERFQNMGLALDPESIRRFRKDVLENSEKPEWRNILNWSDFYNVSDCRDLLFHVQEHRFTISQIKEFLEERNLKFLGFHLPENGTRDVYKQRFPEDSDMTDLDSWDVFENERPDTFRAMYQFWCQKMDA